MVNVRKCYERVISAQTELFVSFQQLGQVLGSYNEMKFPLDQDEDSPVTPLINQFSSTSSELASFIELLTQECSDCVLYPLNKFAEIELPEFENAKEQFNLAQTGIFYTR